jgi:hypothetical protein
MIPVVKRAKIPSGGRLTKGHILRTAFLISLAACFFAQSAVADEVDDILAVKAKNRDRIKSFSAEYVVETKLPKDAKGQMRVSRMRYRMRMERLPKNKAKGLLNPWETEIDVLEPYAMSLRIEGERVWLKKGDDWVEQEMSPQMREQFTGMSERFFGADPAEQRKHFNIKVLRRNSPWFGTQTRTVEYHSKAKVRLFARMQEDLDEEGLSLETRIYDESGQQTVTVKVKRCHQIQGVPVVDEMESVARTPSGEVHSTTTARGHAVELREDGQ